MLAEKKSLETKEFIFNIKKQKLSNLTRPGKLSRHALNYFSICASRVKSFTYTRNINCHVLVSREKKMINHTLSRVESSLALNYVCLNKV